MKLEGKRKFLLVIEEEAHEELEKIIDGHVVQTQFFFANSNSDANVKIANSPPDVIVAKIRGKNIDGLKLAETVVGDSKLGNLPLVLVGQIPDTEVFVDEIVLGRIQILEDIHDDHLVSLALSRVLNFITRNDQEEFHLKFLAPGEFLITKGEDAKHVYIVRRGHLEASVDKGGQKIVLGPVDTGEFVGEMAYINGEPRNADVCATTDCELIEIPINIFDKVLFHKPSWSKALMKTLSARVRAGNLKVT